MQITLKKIIYDTQGLYTLLKLLKTQCGCCERMQRPNEVTVLNRLDFFLLSYNQKSSRLQPRYSYQATRSNPKEISSQFLSLEQYLGLQKCMVPIMSWEDQFHRNRESSKSYKTQAEIYPFPVLAISLRQFSIVDSGYGTLAPHSLGPSALV